MRPFAAFAAVSPEIRNSYDSQLRSRYRIGVSRSASDELEAILLLLDQVWRGAEYQHLSGLPWAAGGIAGFKPHGGRDGRQSGCGSELQGQYRISMGTKELFLPGSSQRLPDFAVRPPAGPTWLY